MWFTMFKLTILDGPQVDLGQMLAAKDARVVKERALLVAAPTNTLLHVTLRIPGPVKTGFGGHADLDAATWRGRSIFGH